MRVNREDSDQFTEFRKFWLNILVSYKAREAQYYKKAKHRFMFQRFGGG